MKNLKKLIFAALLAALTFVATYIIKVPTPTMGYIHPGDGLVLLCGIFLGPLYGGLAAGFGSMLADLVSGYATYAPATFIIKLLTAVIASFIANELIHFWKNEKKTIAVIIGSAVGELFMVLGYFVYEIFLLGILTGGLSASAISSGIAASAAGVPFNMVQGIFGTIIAAVLYPILNPAIKRSLYSN
ncbi:MAG: ECF transporter S component [Lachnospiraceae bacterium]|nr:ECF transporter S component [Lachnospiraceae bacterium]